MSSSFIGLIFHLMVDNRRREKVNIDDAFAGMSQAQFQISIEGTQLSTDGQGARNRLHTHQYTLAQCVAR